MPSSTPKVSLYNELGMIPIKFMLWRRKLGMWWRLNRKESNILMKECVKEQINLSLPWMLGLNKIACKLEIDLNDQWASEIRRENLPQMLMNLTKTSLIAEYDFTF